MRANPDSYFVHYYYTSLFSNGLDDVENYETFDIAKKAARKRIKGHGRGHAIISQRGFLIASVVESKGRVFVKMKRK